jgi:CheY-like chemotaxis protein
MHRKQVCEKLHVFDSLNVIDKLCAHHATEANGILRDKDAYRAYVPPSFTQQPVVIGGLLMWELQKEIRIYIAVKRTDDRTHYSDSMVVDGFNVTAFPSAGDLWQSFQLRPARIVMTERRFEYGISGLQLVERIRQQQPWPYVYVAVMSAMNQMEEIEQGLEAGVDDYLLKPFNPIQLRARALVALRWLSYLDSLCQEQPTRG